MIPNVGKKTSKMTPEKNRPNSVNRCISSAFQFFFDPIFKLSIDLKKIVAGVKEFSALLCSRTENPVT